MEVIIHPGMPKTGSSSIQKTLVNHPVTDWVVPARNSGNMGRELILLFEDEPWNAPAFTIQGVSREEVLSRKEKLLEQLTEQLRKAARQGLNTVFSAERIFNVPEHVVTRLRDFYLDLGFRPRVVGYVRQPVSFMQSAFQQNLKTDTPGLLEPKNLMPAYRRGFEKLDKVFGQENVSLKLFNPGTLRGGDVVVDFFAEMGTDLPSEHAVRVNESLSLEACALLFAQRTLGTGLERGFRTAGRSNARFVEALSVIGKRKLRFSRSFVEPILDRYRPELLWMEERLGVGLLDLPEADGDGMIKSADDLIEEALRHIEAVDALNQKVVSTDFGNDRENLLGKLEMLRQLVF